MTPIERAARELVRQYYYYNGHQPSATVDAYVENEWRNQIDIVRLVLRSLGATSQKQRYDLISLYAKRDARMEVPTEDVWRSLIDSAVEEMP